MKLKTLLAAALAVAVSYAAQAATSWFDAGISAYDAWPVGSIVEVGSWSQGADGVAALCGNDAKYLQLTNSAAELSFTAQVSKDSSLVLPTVTAAIKFTPYDYDCLPDVPTGAKGAVIVVQEEDESYSYRVLKANEAGTDNEWSTAITTETPDLDQAVEVDISYTSVGALAKVTYRVAGVEIASESICATEDPTVSIAAFKGTGEVWSLSGTTEDYGKLTINPAPFLTVSAVKVGTTVIAANPDGTYTIPGAQTVTVEYAANGASGVSGTQTIDFTGADLAVNPTSTPVFFDGEGTPTDPYQIANENDFFYLATVVASNLTGYVTANYQMTADIYWPSDKPFPGIGTNGKNAEAYTLNAFQGIFDGNEKTISNLVLENSTKTTGLFNNIRNATVKDLSVNTVSYAGNITTAKVGGGMIIGGAFADGEGCETLLQGLTSSGTFGADESGKRISGTAAGIVYRIECKNSAEVTVQNCSSSARIYGSYTKLGGICAINEMSSEGGAVTFDGCSFSGTVCACGSAGLTAKDEYSAALPGENGVGGIIGYFSTNPQIVFKDCSVTGTIVGPTAETGSIVGRVQAGLTATSSGCTAPASYRSIGCLKDKSNTSYYGVYNNTGLEYATVENGVATFCEVPAAAEGEFNVMRDIITAPSFVLAGVEEASDVLVFDTTLATFANAPTVTAAPGSHLVAVKDPEAYSYSLELETIEFNVELPEGVSIFEIQGVVDEEMERTVNPFHAKWGSTIYVTYDAGEGYVFAKMAEPDRYYSREDGVEIADLVEDVLLADEIVKSRASDEPEPTDYSFTVTWTAGDYATLTLTIGDAEAIDLTAESSPYEGKAAPNAAIVIAATTEKVAKITVTGGSTLDADNKKFTITYTTEAPVIDPQADVSEVKAAYGITNDQITDAGTLSKVIGWAGAKGVTKATVNALDFAAATPSDAVKAYLFNVDPANAAAIAAEAAKLDITSITFDEAGLPVITDGANGGAGWNGTYKVQGKAALEATSWTDVDGSTAGFNFFRTIIRK